MKDVNVCAAAMNGILGSQVYLRPVQTQSAAARIGISQSKKIADLDEIKTPARCYYTVPAEGVAMSRPSQSPAAIIPRQNKILLSFTNRFVSTIKLGMHQDREVKK